MEIFRTVPTCHPDRPHRALGLCGSCYVMSRPDYGRRRIPRAVVAELLVEQGGRCACCREPLELADATIDHVVPWSLGGSDDRSNLRAACRSCNSRKAARGVAMGPPPPRPRDERATSQAAGDLTLAEAAELLELAPVSLRAAAAKGTLRARLIGKTWVTTRDDVERYRRDHLGRRGRPRGSNSRARNRLT